MRGTTTTIKNTAPIVKNTKKEDKKGAMEKDPLSDAVEIVQVSSDWMCSA